MNGTALSQVLPVFAVVLLSHTVQAMTGFGSTVIALTLGALFMPIEELRLVLVALNLPLSLWVVLRHNTLIERPLLTRRILPWMGLGLAFGLLVATQLRGVWLKRAFGVLVISFALRELWLLWRRRERPPTDPRATSLWLLAAGVVHGIYASGGPLVVTALGGVKLERSAFRATLMALWFTLSVALLVSALAQHQWTHSMTVDSLLLLPCLPMGAALGEWLHHRVPDAGFRGLVQTVLVAAGTALLL